MQSSEGFTYFLATPEKALVDFLYFKSPDINPKKTEIFEQSYRFQNMEQLDWQKVDTFSNLAKSPKLNKIVTALRQWTQESEMETL